MGNNRDKGLSVAVVEKAVRKAAKQVGGLIAEIAEIFPCVLPAPEVGEVGKLL